MQTIESAAAMAAAQSAARDHPGDPIAFEELGSAYFEAGQIDEALGAFRHAVELNPHTARAFDGIGHIFYVKGEPQAAESAYEQGIANDPHYPGNYYGLGILYAAKLGDYQRALNVFERSLEANPGDPFLEANLGCIHARMGQIDRGIQILEAVVRRDPNQAFAHSWLALLYLHQQRLEDAETACRREIAEEDNHSAHRLLGYIYHARGQNRRAISELERAIELEPLDYEARGALAKAYRESGDLAAANDQEHIGREMAWKEDREYGLACFCAVIGEVDQALTLLETTRAREQVMPGWVRIDPEFAFIQEEPRFQALIT